MIDVSKANGQRLRPLETGPAPRAEREGATIADVLRAWQTEGPLVHEPTGIARLDELTGGGPVYGTRWYLLGAPDAGKTLLLLLLAHVYAQRGIAVGLHAVDEEPSDMVTRLAQRVGYSRAACEARDPAVLEDMRAILADLPVRLYGPEWTIEAAGADLAGWAAARAEDGRAPRAFLGIDSVQTVQCAGELHAERDMSEIAAVTARTKAIREVATRHRMIVISTSEVNRGVYASPDPAKQTNAMAGGKWSGAIEFAGRVVACLRNVPGEGDLLDLELPKNKHGPASRPGDPTTAHVFLRIDRRSQTIAEVSYDPPPDDREERRAETGRAQVAADADAAEGIITAEPGIGARALRDAMREALGTCSDARTGAAVRRLLAQGRAHTEPPQPRQGQAVRHYPGGTP